MFNAPPKFFQDITVGDVIGIHFGNLADHVTFTHGCVVVDRDEALLKLKPLPGVSDQGSVGSKPYAEWLPTEFEIGRSGLNRRAAWFESGPDRVERLRLEARDSFLESLLRETGHADFERDPDGEILGSVRELMGRLEALGLKIPDFAPSTEAADLREVLDAQAPSRAAKPSVLKR